MKPMTQTELDAVADYINRWGRRLEEKRTSGRAARGEEHLCQLAWNAFREEHKRASLAANNPTPAPSVRERGFAETPEGFFFID